MTDRATYVELMKQMQKRKGKDTVTPTANIDYVSMLNLRVERDVYRGGRDLDTGLKADLTGLAFWEFA